MGPNSARLWWCLPGTPIHEGNRWAAYLASERTVVNLPSTFPFSTNRSVGWTGKKFTDNETAQLGVDVHSAAAHIPTHIQHTHNNEFAPLASPVESRVLRE